MLSPSFNESVELLPTLELLVIFWTKLFPYGETVVLGPVMYYARFPRCLALALSGSFA